MRTSKFPHNVEIGTSASVSSQEDSLLRREHHFIVTVELVILPLSALRDKSDLDLYLPESRKKYNVSQEMLSYKSVVEKEANMHKYDGT